MRRVSIARVMVAISAMAVGAAALRDASEAWAGALLLATLALLACSAFGVAYRGGAARAGWFGFAVFGWGYLAVAVAPWVSDQARAALPSSRALAALHERLKPKPGPITLTLLVDDMGTGTVPAARGKEIIGYIDQSAKPGTSGFSAYMKALYFVNADVEHFQRVGHCLIALMAGLIGAFLARRFQRGSGTL